MHTQNIALMHENQERTSGELDGQIRELRNELANVKGVNAALQKQVSDLSYELHQAQGGLQAKDAVIERLKKHVAELEERTSEDYLSTYMEVRGESCGAALRVVGV